MKIAVITGASSGMGKELLIALEKEYKFDEIWAIARREDKLKKLSEMVKTPIRAVPLDLGKEESYSTYAEMLKAENPQITLLINCSGFGKFGEVSKVPLKDSLNMIDVNCKGYVAMTELSLPYMPKNSRILMLDSLSAFQPVPYMTTYGATKAFVLSYSRALNMELKKRKISVMVISPGWVQTEFFDRALVTNGNNDVKYYNKFYTASEVAESAVKDLKRGKEISICGFRNKLQVLLVKLLPTKTVMKTWLKQQGHETK